MDAKNAACKPSYLFRHFPQNELTGIHLFEIWIILHDLEEVFDRNVLQLIIIRQAHMLRYAGERVTEIGEQHCCDFFFIRGGYVGISRLHKVGISPLQIHKHIRHLEREVIDVHVRIVVL